jgi:hypothetical protein
MVTGSGTSGVTVIVIPGLVLIGVPGDVTGAVICTSVSGGVGSSVKLVKVRIK